MKTLFLIIFLIGLLWGCALEDDPIDPQKLPEIQKICDSVGRPGATANIYMKTAAYCSWVTPNGHLAEIMLPNRIVDQYRVKP